MSGRYDDAAVAGLVEAARAFASYWADKDENGGPAGLGEIRRALTAFPTPAEPAKAAGAVRVGTRDELVSGLTTLVQERGKAIADAVSTPPTQSQDEVPPEGTRWDSGGGSFYEYRNGEIRFWSETRGEWLCGGITLEHLDHVAGPRIPPTPPAKEPAPESAESVVYWFDTDNQAVAWRKIDGKIQVRCDGVDWCDSPQIDEKHLDKRSYLTRLEPASHAAKWEEERRGLKDQVASLTQTVRIRNEQAQSKDATIADLRAKLSARDNGGELLTDVQRRMLIIIEGLADSIREACGTMHTMDKNAAVDAERGAK